LSAAKNLWDNFAFLNRLYPENGRERCMGSRGTWVAVAVAAVTVLMLRGAAHAADGPNVTARSALVMDAETGAVLWARDADLALPPASTTKVMTAILALESGAHQRSFAASPEACSVVPSKVNLRPGQRLSLEDLVYAILLNSANDASVVIAENLAGSVPAFADRMTARARQLGALHTHFANPHGLTADDHYSTARDLATIFRHALDVPKFREIIGTKAIAIDVENSPRKITLRSHNRLLEGYRIPVIGKTGYTIPAKKCFVGAGTYEGREIIVALLGSTDLWGDTRRLLEFGFGDAFPPAPTLQQAKLRPVRGRARAGEAIRSAARAQRYAIQVGTFDRMDRARRLQRALGKRGYDAEIDRVASGRGRNKRTQYRVQVGTYPNRGQAESAVRTMAAQVDVPAVVIQR
jgi:serine-type D-Ala-D-Ala carboxypeptidase (penicillin-binding protein 5/6)